MRTAFRTAAHRAAALARTVFAPLVASLALACDGAPERGPQPAARFAAAPRMAGGEGAARLTGTFRVRYPGVRDATYAEWRGDFRRARFLEDLAAWLNGWIALPRGVTLVFDECGEPNAFYEPEKREVVVCYELVEELDQVFADEADPAQAVDDALVFTVLHEVGHALVHVLDVPITGREEDAVDQLAALVLADGTAEGDAAAINGVRGLPDEDEVDDLAVADEHALSGQRYYNVLCLVYGQDPEAYAAWVDDGTLPEERAARCPAEYAQASSSWERLLAPYLKEDASGERKPAS